MPCGFVAAKQVEHKGKRSRVPECEGKACGGHAQRFGYGLTRVFGAGRSKVQHNPVKFVIIKGQVIISGGQNFGAVSHAACLRPQLGIVLRGGHVKAVFPQQGQQFTAPAVHFKQGAATARPGCKAVLHKLLLHMQGILPCDIRLSVIHTAPRICR